MLDAPWTQIGSLQQDVSSLKSELYRKADSHEIHSLDSRLDRLADSLRSLESVVDGLRSQLETQARQLEEHQATLFPCQ